MNKVSILENNGEYRKNSSKIQWGRLFWGMLMYIIVYRLLNILNESDKGSLEAHLAECILNLLDQIEYYSIDQVAHHCHVSKSTLSKFVRKMNFESYKEFREFAIYEKTNEDRNPKDIFVEQNGMEAYIELLKKDLDVMYHSVSKKQVIELAKAIYNHKEVVAFGSLYSQTAAMDLVFQMGTVGKYIKTYIDDIKQEQYFRDADENALIIIFSNSGQYLFSERMKVQDQRKDYIKNTKAKIALITSNPLAAAQPFVDYPLLYHFSSQIANNVILSRVIITLIQEQYNKITKHNQSKI